MTKIVKKKQLFFLGFVVILIGVSVGIVGFRVHQQRQEELRMEEEREEALEITNTYMRLYYAFGLGRSPEDLEGLAVETIERVHRSVGGFGPLITNPEPNEHGIWVDPYLALRFYYHRTGVYLSYEKAAIDYFLEEYEPDGTLRLYNNGHHPEMEAFVTWMWEGRRREELLEYIDTISSIHRRYFRDQRGEGFTLQNFSYLSPQMLDALARSEADPDYELNLTSLQEAGY